ncbi:MAG: TOBE domain-containing protein [Gammaproteobacteria bacterium]|nr:TOBE domain-containing protein [Gammaproteobacteria bacterium]
MLTSARNQISAIVSAVEPGAVNSQLVLTTSQGDQVVAVVTRDSVQQLGLAPGVAVTALIKAPWVMLASDDGSRYSARNQLAGTVTTIERGAVNSMVSVKTAAGTVVVASVTNSSVSDMGLVSGSKVVALFKASHIIVAVPA